MEVDEEYKHRVCGRLAELQHHYDYSNYKVAKDVGVAQTTVANIMDAKSMPSIMTLRGMCEMFDRSVCDFFFEIEPEKGRKHVSQKESELLDEFERLDDSNKEILLKIAQSMADAQENEKKKRPNRK